MRNIVDKSLGPLKQTRQKTHVKPYYRCSKTNIDCAFVGEISLDYTRVNIATVMKHSAVGHAGAIVPPL